MARTVKLNPEQQQRVVELHRNEHVSTEELARVYGVSQNTVWRVLRRFNAVKRPNASKYEQDTIRRLSGKRTREQIATLLERSCSFIETWQRKQKFHAHPKLTPRLENQIVALYKTGIGQKPVGRALNVSEKVVHAVLVRHHVPLHKGSPPFQMPPERFDKFRADVLSKKYFCVDLARKYGISKHNSLKLAKQILGVETFFRGETYPPLSSTFPERHDKTLSIADYCRFLVGIFPDGVPEKPPWDVVPPIISMLLEKFPFWREASTADLLSVESHLTAALATMRESQTALVN